MADIEKTCIICGQSCAGQPRIKDGQGRYAHQACAEQRQDQAGSSRPGHQPDADELAGDEAMMGELLRDGFDGGLGTDMLLDDLPEEAGGIEGGMRTGCPGCGSSLAPGTAICMSCGFDTRSGKAAKTRIKKAKEPKSGLGGVAASAGSAAASGLGALAGSAIGACVGGAVGAGIWAGIIIALNLEIGWAAIGVGVLCGIGAAIGARQNAGVLTGLIAVVVTLLSISAGKYFGVVYIANRAMNPEVIVAEFTGSERTDYGRLSMADEILSERMESEDLDDETTEAYTSLLFGADSIGEYPDDVQTQAIQRWNAMSDTEQTDYLISSFDLTGVDMDAVYQDHFVASFGLFDLLFFGIGCAAAYKAGSGGAED